MKVQLIYPGVDEGYRCTSQERALPPTGLVYVASFLKENVPETEIEIFHGMITADKEIEQRLGAEFVGISTHMGNYLNALKLAKIAKQKGAHVTLGGPYASPLAERILKNREFIDDIIVTDGEEAYTKLVKGESKRIIENLVYREGNEIKTNPRKTINLDILPLLNYELVNSLDNPKYAEAVTARYGQKFGKVLGISLVRGCAYRARSKFEPKGCIFCGILLDTYRTTEPKRAWEHITHLTKEYSVDLIRECSDSFTGSKKWLRHFASTKPTRRTPKIDVLARADELDEETIKLLKKINVSDIFIGVESGSVKTIETCGKGETLENILRSVEFCNRAGLRIKPSFILGLPGETEETAQTTLTLAKKIHESINYRSVAFSILTPIPASRALFMMINNLQTRIDYNPNNPNELLTTDVFDWEKLRQVWIKNYCNVNYTYLINVVKEVAKIYGPEKTQIFGSTLKI